MSKRIYIVEPQGDIAGGDSRLVVAASQGEALRIVTGNTFACRVATTIEVAELIGAGKQLEKQTKEGIEHAGA